MWFELYDIMKKSARVHIPIGTLIVATLVLAGWQFNAGFLVRPLPNLDATNPLAAIGFLLSAVAVLLLVHKPRTGVWLHGARITAWLVLLIGLLRIVDIATGNLFNIDQWLFAQRLLADDAASLPNRMGLLSAIGFFLLGLSLLLAGYRWAFARQCAGLAAFIVMWAGLVCTLGYIYRVREFYQLLAIMPVSITGAMLFALIGRATLAVNPESAFLQTFSSPYLGGILARRFVPIILIAPGLVGFAGLWIYRYRAFSPGLGVAVLVATIVTILFALIWFLAIRLNNSDKARTESENALKEFNKNLEATVAERTEKVIKLNRLSTFLSAINQAIVHTTTVEQLMENICNTATGIGQFKVAGASLLNEHNKLSMVAISGPPVATFTYQQNAVIDLSSATFRGTMLDVTMRTGKYVVSNDVQNDPAMLHRRQYLVENDIRASIALPVKKFGRVVGVMAFHSTVKNFFDEAEIALLQEAANDASFAMELIHNEELRLLGEKQLAQSEANLKRAQQLAHVGHWQLSFASSTAVWSDEACRIYGLPPEDNTHTFEAWLSFVHPDDRQAVTDTIQQSQQSLSNYSLEHRIVRRDGTVRYLQSETTFEFDAQHKPVGLYGVLHDVTDIKLQQEAIRKSEANLSAIIENTDAVIYSLDRNLKCLTYNSNLKNMLDAVYGFEVKPGVDLGDFIAKTNATDFNDWNDTYAHALAGNPMQFVKEYTIGDVKTYTSFYINPIREGNEVIGVSCMGRDITAQKMAELEIKALNESLELKVKERTAQLSKLNKELEKFSVTVSHDLQAPLRAINGFSKILLEDYKDKLDEEGREFLGIIDTNVLRMSDLIRDLLDFSRMGKPMKIKLTDMTELAATALKDIQSHTPGFKAHVTLKPMPPAVCDQALMQQVWTNLISNAVKYSSKKPQPEIEIGTLDTKPGEPVYYIRDNGVGFDMQTADKLFEPFNRLHSISDFEGTGIGLSTVHRIISRHGGTIWAESEVDKGATFYFTLP